MKKLYYKNAIPAVIVCFIMATGCKRHELPIIKKFFNISILPVIGDTSRESIVFTKPTRPRQPNLWRPDPKYHELQSKPKLTLLWRGQPFIHPRGIMLDPDNDALWVADPGDSELNPMDKQARIIRVPVINGTPGKPKIFYSKPDFLYSAEWALPVRIEGKKMLVVADQGKATATGTFTGEGAKVFILPVLAGGSPGEPTVLWEGPPFKCPTGLAVVGDVIYITDPSAGPLRLDPKNVGFSFPTSAIFAVPLPTEKANLASKTPPILLRQGAPFVSLSGICSSIPGELIISDTDSGIPDEGGAVRPGLPPPRTSDEWVLRIIDPGKLSSSKPLRAAFAEQGNGKLSEPDRNINDEMAEVELSLSGIADLILARELSRLDKIQISGRNGTMIIDSKGKAVKTISVPILIFSGPIIPGAQTKIKIKTRSNVGNSSVTFEVVIPKTKSCAITPPQQIIIQKDPGRGNMNRDNKSGGARVRGAELAGPKNGKRNMIYDRFTLDNAKGHGSVWIYPDGGGVPVAIAIGAPLLRPFAGQLSPNQEQLWFTDQANGSLYSLPFPSAAIFDSLYGVQKPIR